MSSCQPYHRRTLKSHTPTCASQDTTVGILLPVRPLVPACDTGYAWTASCNTVISMCPSRVGLSYARRFPTQAIIINFLGIFFKVEPLDWKEWLVSLAIGTGAWPLSWLTRFISRCGQSTTLHGTAVRASPARGTSMSPGDPNPN